MRVESNVLVELIKKAQTERFNENKISGLVYNTRVGKYKQKLEKIKEQLPVFEQKLNIISKQNNSKNAEIRTPEDNITIFLNGLLIYG